MGPQAVQCPYLVTEVWLTSHLVDEVLVGKLSSHKGVTKTLRSQMVSLAFLAAPFCSE